MSGHGIVKLSDLVLFDEVGEDEPDSDDIFIAHYPYPLKESVRLRLSKTPMSSHIPNISLEFVAEAWAETLRSRGFHEEADQIWPQEATSHMRGSNNDNPISSCPEADPP
jgi:hypothetical protein